MAKIKMKKKITTLLTEKRTKEEIEKEQIKRNIEIQKGKHMINASDFKKKINEINDKNLNLLRKLEEDMLITGGYSISTIANYRSDLINWFFYIKEKQKNKYVLEMTVNEIDRYLKYCSKVEDKKRTLRRENAISCLYDFLIRKGLYENERPLYKIKKNRKIEEEKKRKKDIAKKKQKILSLTMKG